MRTPLLLLLCALPSVAEAGPWSTPTGTVYAKASTRVLLGSRYTDGAGTTTSIPGYREVATGLYGELGLGRGFAALVQWDVLRWFQLRGPEGQSVTRPGDARIGARYTLLEFGGAGALAVEGWLGIPIASGDAVAALADDDGLTVALLRAGPGVAELTGRLELGWAWRYGWTSAGLGWGQRFGGYDGLVDWRAEIGGRWWRLQGVLRLGGRHAVDTGDADRVENPAGLSNGTSYTSTIMEFGFDLSDHWQVGTSMQLSLAGLGVRSQARGPVFTGFVAFRR